MPIRFVMAVAILCFVASSGAAQERKSRKVYTNEDIARPSATPVGTLEKSTESVPDAGVQQTQATPLPEGQAEGPGTELQKALGLQQMLRQNFEEYQTKIASETDPVRKSQWTSLSECMNELLQQNQQIIDEMSQERQRNSQQAGSPPES